MATLIIFTILTRADRFSCPLFIHQKRWRKNWKECKQKCSNTGRLSMWPYGHMSHSSAESSSNWRGREFSSASLHGQAGGWKMRLIKVTLSQQKKRNGLSLGYYSLWNDDHRCSRWVILQNWCHLRLRGMKTLTLNFLTFFYLIWNGNY